MTRAVVILLALSVYLGSTPRAEAQQSLGQSDWQMPAQSENQWQPQVQQAQTQQAQTQPAQNLGQSDWQQTGQTQNQWQSQPQQQIGQSEWQTPQGQSQWQQPGSQYGQQANGTYYGNASSSQFMPQNGNGQYQEPGAYLYQPNNANQGKSKKHHKDKEPDPNKGQTAEIIKATAGAVSRVVATTAPVAGSVMSSYFIGKGIARGGYYNPMMFGGYGGYGGGYGYNPYFGNYNRYPNPYGYGYGYNNGFMHF